MVFEAGALVLLLPESLPLSAGLGASHLPVPCIALAWQVLAIRLMLGFAKTKFGESDDNLFLQGFFIWQLLPNHLSWHLHHAPLWLLRASYGFMLYVEVILPFCAFFTGPPRFVGAWGLIVLMLGIFLTGNWGQFNLGYIVVCLGLLDLQISYASFFSHSWLLPPVMLVYLFISLICCVFDTWTNTAWMWYTWEIIPMFQLHNLLGLVRFLAPFRLINAYGVFPPEALPQAMLGWLVIQTVSAHNVPSIQWGPQRQEKGEKGVESPKHCIETQPGRLFKTDQRWDKELCAMIEAKHKDLVLKMDHQCKLLELILMNSGLVKPKSKDTLPSGTSSRVLGSRRPSNSGAESRSLGNERQADLPQEAPKEEPPPPEPPAEAKAEPSSRRSSAKSERTLALEAKAKKRPSFTPQLFKTFSQTDLTKKKKAHAASMRRSASMEESINPHMIEEKPPNWALLGATRFGKNNPGA
eukprot:s2581_g4.t1